jgi:uncharacterized protein (TIGR02145 family)
MKSKPIKQLFLIITLVLVVLTGCKKDDKKNDDPKPVKPDPATVTDIDGNTYKTVRINTQLWMAENLRVTRFNDGTPIPTTDPPDKDLTGEPDGIYQWITMYDTTLLEDLGRVYSLTVGQHNLRNVCPEGWRVPTRKDWKTLIADLQEKPDSNILDEGHILMEQNSLYWEPSSNPFVEAPNNETGFTARGGGVRPINATSTPWYQFKTVASFMIQDYHMVFKIYSSSTKANSGDATISPYRHIRCIME